MADGVMEYQPKRNCFLRSFDVTCRFLLLSISYEYFLSNTNQIVYLLSLILHYYLFIYLFIYLTRLIT